MSLTFDQLNASLLNKIIILIIVIRLLLEIPIQFQPVCDWSV